MKIFLIRHAEAIEYKTESVRTDEYRYITPEGRRITGKVVRKLKDEFTDLERIYTSPLVRAVQTAEIIAAELKFRKEVELINELKNESTIASLQMLLDKNSGLTSVAFVGHEPKLSLLVSILSDKKDLKDFGKSSVCLIDRDQDSGIGKFKWYFEAGKMEFRK